MALSLPVTSAMPTLSKLALNSPVAPSENLDCYHCGERLDSGQDFGFAINGEHRPMCCPGCRSVASLIYDSGMSAYYERRSAFGERPDEPSNIAQEALLIYDDPEVAAQFCDITGDEWEARLLISGIHCAACTWLIEHSLLRLKGVKQANVSLQHQRLDIRFDSSLQPLSAIFAQIEALGYKAQPFYAGAQREQAQAEYRLSLQRLAIAGLGMMQVGMFGIALHAGDLQGIASEHQGLMRWVSLIIATIVVLFSSRVFFSTAWRHLKAGMLVMDLPVAIAIGLAWLASAWATISGSGQVYFDSVVMFTFFLLLGRFLEQRVRRRFQLNWFQIENTLPQAVQRFEQGTWLTVPRIAINKDDIVLVPAGSTVPIDGSVIKGRSSVREDTFNGEQDPRPVGLNDSVFTGTLNLEAALEVKAAGSYNESRLAALQESVGRANTGKPRLANLADKIAAWFVLLILVTTGGTALIWSQIDPSQALWISLSVLVISCPCALALATPVALTSAASALRHRGVLVHGENALEALSRSTRLILDKTGTLTEGRLTLNRLELLGPLSQDKLTTIAAALQQSSRHPIAKVFEHEQSAPGVSELHYQVGAGVSGVLDGQEYRMGSLAYCRELAPSLAAPPSHSLYWVALVRDQQPLAWYGFQDPIRSEAGALIKRLQERGVTPEILSGDTPERVAEAAAALGISKALGGQSPEQKMARVEALQAEGFTVTAVGDGLNDAPLLGMANASFAVTDATDLARAQADFVINNGNLNAVDLSWQMALRCRSIIRQNLCWALGYNICAIPLAAMGYIPPWAAAIGMSASSLLVVLNSLRLTRGLRSPLTAQVSA
ncbi:heavy metal translocating P-type ATPase [Sediminihaliea albiluteola]|nr:heavy metal translocating P-type ATPase [Sediminihaliea albiluteola]